MRIIAVVNQKGGVAKTTTAVNLAVGLAQKHYRVLLVDLDPQAHSTLALRVNSSTIGPEQTVVPLFYGGTLTDIVVDTVAANVQLVPASIRLATAVESLYSVTFREVKLAKALEAVTADFDYVFLDCAPTLSVLSVNAIVAATQILIPTPLSLYALDGLNELLNTIETLKPDPNAFDWRVLFTRVKGHGKKRQAELARIIDPIADRILTTRIRETEAVEDSQSDEEKIMAVVLRRGASNRGAQDYRRLVQEVTELWPA